MKHASDYEGGNGHRFEPFDAQGYTVISCLPFLVGRKWDDIAIGFVHALRPSSIRICRESVCLDASKWRVTVWIRPDGMIGKIEQEVVVGLPEGIEHGEALELAVR